MKYQKFVIIVWLLVINSKCTSSSPKIISCVKMKKVVIVGAGISGLACAMELSKHKGYEIVILEGDSRIGGRIKDVSIGEESYVDAGASWFHAAQNNPLYKLALEMFHNSNNSKNNSNNDSNGDIKKNGEEMMEIKIDKKSKMMSRFYSSKFSITEEEEKRAAEIAEELEAKFIEEMESFQQKDKKAVDESYAETLERLLTESSLSSQLKDQKTYQIFRAFVERFQSYEGGAFDTLSVKYCLEDHVANDPQLHKTGVPGMYIFFLPSSLLYICYVVTIYRMRALFFI